MDGSALSREKVISKTIVFCRRARPSHPFGPKTTQKPTWSHSASNQASIFLRTVRIVPKNLTPDGVQDLAFWKTRVTTT